MSLFAFNPLLVLSTAKQFLAKGFAILGLAAMLSLTACSGNNTAYDGSNNHASGETANEDDEGGKLFEGNFFAQNDKKPASSRFGGIGINGYLWRASLDAISFLPLSSADPFGGVIITDWYSPPDTPNERIKVTVYILDKRLRADGLRISIFRQTRQNGAWVEASVAPQTARQLENAILTRAREMRIANVNAAE